MSVACFQDQAATQNGSDSAEDLKLQSLVEGGDRPGVPSYCEIIRRDRPGQRSEVVLLGCGVARRHLDRIAKAADVDGRRIAPVDPWHGYRLGLPGSKGD